MFTKPSEFSLCAALSGLTCLQSIMPVMPLRLLGHARYSYTSPSHNLLVLVLLIQSRHSYSPRIITVKLVFLSLSHVMYNSPLLLRAVQGVVRQLQYVFITAAEIVRIVRRDTCEQE